MYAYYACPECHDTKMLVQFGESVTTMEGVEFKFFCRLCKKQVVGELITSGEGKCYQAVSHHENV